MVFKNKSFSDESSSVVPKTPSTKFVSKTRSDNVHYSTHTSRTSQEFIYTKYSEQDVQEEFLRVYTQLEVLKERNMRMGNRHLASKIIAMQDAARTHDNIKTEENLQNPLKSSSSLGTLTGSDIDDISPLKIKRQSVSFVPEPKINGETTTSIKKTKEFLRIAEEYPSNSICPSREVKNNEVKNSNDSNGKYLMSGHANTHSIVINLDDKSRFTDEITV